MSKFKTSMANPEFKKLFFDYMKEISDPANKQVFTKINRSYTNKSWPS